MVPLGALQQRDASVPRQLVSDQKKSGCDWVSISLPLSEVFFSDVLLGSSRPESHL